MLEKYKEHKEIVYAFSTYNQRVIGGFVIKKFKKLCKGDAIVITNSLREYGLLMDAIGNFSWRNSHGGQYPTRQDYNCEWTWVIENGIHSGSAGWNSKKYTIERRPELPVFTSAMNYIFVHEH